MRSGIVAKYFALTLNSLNSVAEKLEKEIPAKLEILTEEEIPIEVEVDARFGEDRDYPFPDDTDAEFRKKCKDRFHYILTYC